MARTRLTSLGGKQVNKTTVMTRILQLVHEICTKGIHVTKRDLFYTDVKLFEARAHVIGCSRVLRAALTWNDLWQTGPEALRRCAR